MPIPAAVNEVWKVVLRCKIENQDHLNVLHFHIDSAVDDIQLRLLKALVDCFLLNMMPGLTTEFNVVGAVGHRILPTLGPDVEYFPTGESVSTVGLATGDGLPSYVSSCISIHTTRGGRSGRGRMFISGIPESSTTFSELTGTGVFWVALLAYIVCVTDAFIHSGDPGTNQISIGVFSTKDMVGNDPATALGFAPATVLIPHRALGTNRSRKIGHGS